MLKNKMKRHVKTQKELESFLRYENGILDLKKFVFYFNCSITIDSTNGYFQLWEDMGPSTPDEPLEVFETLKEVYDFFKE